MIPIGFVIELDSADPAPVVHAALTRHVIAASLFLGHCPAMRASSYEWVGRLPDIECRGPFVLALARVPEPCALEAHGSTAAAGRLICENPRVVHCLSAIRLWAPLKVAVLTHSDIFTDGVKFAHYILGTETLDVFWLEKLGTLMLHAGQPHGIAVIDLYL